MVGLRFRFISDVDREYCPKPVCYMSVRFVKKDPAVFCVKWCIF